MKFDLKKPCAHCPFRSDIAPYLRVARVREILRSVVRFDKTFACHETTQVGRGKRILRRDHQACAGSMILVWRSGWRNAMYQIAERFGWLDLKALSLDSPVVFLSPWAMLRATVAANKT